MMGLFIILTVVTIHTVSKLTKPYTLNMGSLLPVDYISIKLGEGERGEGVGEEKEKQPQQGVVFLRKPGTHARVRPDAHIQTLSTKLPFGL